MIQTDPSLEAILDWLAICRNDPYRFVMTAFPWREPGTVLEDWDGPSEWQKWVLDHVASGLIDINTAIQIAVASGHGIGKSALVAWLILWAFTTAPDTRGVVSDNSETQLKT